MKVIFTNEIPQCPYCEKPTQRKKSGGMLKTSAYYPPKYDENGVNTNPDRNTITKGFRCLECDKSYKIAGNAHTGWNYKLKEVIDKT